jgi:hypothetical protein
VIVLDTHIWVWWAHEPGNLTQRQIDEVKKNEGNIIGISVISCWEIAKLVEYNRLELPLPLDEWFEKAMWWIGDSQKIKNFKNLSINCVWFFDTGLAKTSVIVITEVKAVKSPAFKKVITSFINGPYSS